MPAHISDLPTELLREVFRYTVPEFPNFRSDFAPLALTHVCKAWRKLATETPELWTNVVINNAALRRRNVLPLLHAWLQHSEPRLLDVDIDINILDGEVRNMSLDAYRQKQNVYRRLLQLLVPHRHRIKNLRGILPISVTPDLVDGMNSVEMMDLIGISEVSSSDRPMHLHFSKPLPQLHYLSLESIGLEQASLVNQQQLTRLELSEMRNPTWMNCQAALQVLQTLPNLRTAYFGLNRPADNESMPRERVSFPELRELYVSCDDWEVVIDTQPFFDAISAPNLEKLALRGSVDTATGSWDALLRFLLASGSPPLTHLAISDMGTTDMRLEQILRVTPTLTHLIVNHALVTPALLRSLIWDPIRPDFQLAPNLRSIRFGACEDFEDTDILPVLHSRVSKPGQPLRGVAELQEVVLRQCAKLQVENEKYIRETGIPNVVLDSDNTLTSPFGGLLDFLRIVENHRDFFDEWRG